MTKTLFYGASSVAGDGASSEANRFSSIVCRALGWEEINFGIGGTTVVGRDEEGMVIAQDSGIARVPDVIAASPDLIFIHFGANDFAQSKLLGDARQFRQGTYFWDYDTMVRGLLASFDPHQIFVSTAQYRSDAEIPNNIGAKLADYNQVTREVGERYGLCTMDAYADADINAANWEMFAADASHLNDAGYQVLAAFYTESIRKHLCL